LRIAVNSYEAKRQINEMQRAHLKTELRFLKSQLNPHFLFNTINNLYSLALEKSDKTPDALLKMSSLLRYFLYECTKDKVPVEKEWSALLAYQDLFNLSHEQQPNVSLSNDIKSNGMIEPMILIPLIENCYKHSGIDFEPAAFIDVKIAEENGFLQADFINSIGNNIQKENEKNTGIGLAAIQKRLSMHYPGTTPITIIRNENSFHVHLLIPFS
jgi:two-component system, LytTR family, sensor kinase